MSKMDDKVTIDCSSTNQELSEDSKNDLKGIKSQSTDSENVTKSVFKIPTFVKKNVNKSEMPLQNEKITCASKHTLLTNDKNIDIGNVSEKKSDLKEKRPLVSFQPKSLALPSQVYKPHRPSASEYLKHFNKKDKEKIVEKDVTASPSDNTSSKTNSSTKHKQNASVSKSKPITLQNYNKPEWSSSCEENPEHPYSLEVLKTGSIIDKINLANKEYFVFGRLSDCDIVLEHPSISRLVHLLFCNCLPCTGIDPSVIRQHQM